jgi:hypothetical protein
MPMGAPDGCGDRQRTQRRRVGREVRTRVARVGLGDGIDGESADGGNGEFILLGEGRHGGWGSGGDDGKLTRVAVSNGCMYDI